MLVSFSAPGPQFGAASAEGKVDEEAEGHAPSTATGR